MISRRIMLAGTIAAGASLASRVDHVRAQGPGKRLVVDAQAHLWREASDWAPGSPMLPEPFTYQRALPLMDAAGIDRVVIIPPTPNSHNLHALEAARAHPDRFAVMGSLPLDDPGVAQRLPTWRQQPGMLGLRLYDPTLAKRASSGELDWVWAAAQQAGLPIMFPAPGQAAAFASVAERHPRLALIISHMGVNAAIARDGRVAEAIAQTASLAKYPNVSVKLSNLPNASREEYPFRDIRDHIKRLFDLYGPQRCHWGSDVTNNMAKADWRKRLDHVADELDFLSEADKDWILGRSILQRLAWA